MTLTDPKRLAKSLCVKLKRLTNEIVKNAKSKCEIEINELKIDDGESEHDLQIDGTVVKMKTAFIKIRNRSTLSLTDIDDSKEESLEESLNKILSEENIQLLKSVQIISLIALHSITALSSEHLALKN